MQPLDENKGCTVATQKHINVNKVFIDVAALEVNKEPGRESCCVPAGLLQSTAEGLLSKVPAHPMLTEAPAMS